MTTEICQSRKGVVVTQLAWVFVLIAGGIIITFFVMIAQTQTKASAQTFQKDLIAHVDTLIKSAQAAQDSFTSVEVPNTDFEFRCYEGDTNFYIKGTGVREDLSKQAVFSPRYVEGNAMLIYVLTMHAPYRVGNLVYITSPDNMYYFLTDSSYTDPSGSTVGTAPKQFKALYETIPEIPKIWINSRSELNKLQDANFDHITVIYLDDQTTPGFTSTDLDAIKRLPSSKTTVVKINPKGYDDPAINQLTAFGEVEFYRPGQATPLALDDAPDSVFPYISKPWLMGALFSEDPDTYACNLKKIINDWKFVHALYQDRTQLIATDYTIGTGSSCASPFQRVTAASGPFETMQANLDLFPESTSEPWIQAGATRDRDIWFAQKSIETANQDAIRGNRCAYIY